MWKNFLVAVDAVMPFVIYLALGYFAVKGGLADTGFMNRLNRFSFKLFYPLLMFKNVYGAAPESMPSLTLILVSVIGILVLIGTLWTVVPLCVKENPRRGVVIQALFRSNFLLYGIPLIVSVFGEARASVAGFMTLIVISLFNIAAVVVLESFNSEGGGFSITSLLLKLVKNPLLQGCLAGLLFFAFKIKLPSFLSVPVNALGNMATPLGMITLGGTLKFSAFGKNKRIIAGVTGLRLVLIPLIMLLIGYAFGLRGAELFLMLVIFGTPVAVASYTMAANMGGDGELAGQLVVVTTLVSLVTIFLFIFFMGQMNLLA
ncbi:MAG: AEC family transporter [Clostridia bacterium]|nr:AEC family transporter [Clostridia bacterium]